MTTAHKPKLAKPGAGLPFVEWAVAKYIIFPQRFKNASKQTAIAEFASESAEIVRLAKSLSPEQQVERRLIKRLRGLEDSSRYWSVAMTLDHLSIVGSATTDLIVGLSTGKSGFKIIGTADVKPDVVDDPTLALTRFEQMTTQFLQAVTPLSFDPDSTVKHPHPWFGPLNAYQWLVFAAPHQNIHRQQIAAIIALL